MFRFILSLVILAFSCNAFAEPKVMVTIKPIHVLVKDIMQTIGTPKLLMASHDTPHHYSLKPSQARDLHRMQLVIWVGPQIESFMQKILLTLKKRIQVVELSKIQGLALLPVRRGKDWKTQHSHAHIETEEQSDPHIWLDPHNAKVIVQNISNLLQQIDAQNAEIYQKNATHLLKKLDALDDKIQRQLAPIKNMPFLVFHDAYQYFEHHYGLNVVGVINLSPDTTPSPRHLHQLRALIKQKKVRCVFSEPQFQSTLVNTVTEGTLAKKAILDPLGTELTDNEGYLALLTHLSNSIKHCLK